METNSMQMIPDGGTTRHVFAMNSLFVRKCTFYSSQVVPVVATKPRHGFLGILQSIVILRSHRQPHYFPPELFHPTLAMRHDDATLTQPLLWLWGASPGMGRALLHSFCQPTARETTTKTTTRCIFVGAIFISTGFAVFHAPLKSASEWLRWGT